MARQAFGGREFSRKDYLGLFPTVSTASASRDLRQGVDEKILTKHGVGPLSRYQFRSRASAR